MSACVHRGAAARAALALLAAVAAGAARAEPAPAAAAPAALQPAPLFPVLKDGKWGFIDASGQLVIAPAFDRAGPFSEGLAAVQQGAMHAYVDRTGKLAIVPAQQPAATVHRRFSSGRAAVKVNGRYGYIDRTGSLVIPARYRQADDFSEGFAMVCDPKLGCGYVDVDGKGAVAPGLMGGGPARSGIACGVVMMAMSRHVVALQPIGGARQKAEYAGCGVPSEGLVAVRVRDRWGYVDLAGNPAIPLAFAWAGDFSGGLAPATDTSGRCGFVDRTGAFAVAPAWRKCDRFSDGLARVDLAQRPDDAEHWAFVDRTGKVVVDGAALEPPFDSATSFTNGLAAVGQGGEPWLAAPGGPLLGYVDTAGRWVWRPSN